MTTTLRLPLLAARLFDTPLLIHERKLHAIIGAMAPRLGLAEALSADLKAAAADPFLARHNNPVDPDGYAIAVIPIHSSLVHRCGDVDALSGVQSYESIRADLRDGLADASVEAILFDIDSGGGECAGLFDLVDEIFAAREQKPIYAFANEHAYSAAYAIASAADKIFMPRTGGIGSIGTVRVHLDESGYNEKQGFSYTIVKAGKHKTDGSCLGPLSKEAKAEWQRDIDALNAIFISTVARNRGMDANTIDAMEAACFLGQRAVDAGLADGIATLDDVISIIAADLDAAAAQVTGQSGWKALSGPAGEHSEEENAPMALKNILTGKKAPAKAETDDEIDAKKADSAPADDEKDDAPGDDPKKKKDPQDDQEGDEAKAGKVAAMTVGLKVTTKVEEPHKAEESAQIVELCTLYGTPGMAAAFIREGCMADAVRTKLLGLRNEEAKADTAAGKHISTNHNDRKDSENSNPVSAEIDRRVAEMKKWSG